MSITVTFPDGTAFKNEFPLTAREVLARTSGGNGLKTVACRVNHVERPLSWRISMDADLEFVTLESIEGMEVYSRTLSFMLTSAAHRVCNMKLHLRQSMNYSYYYESPDGPVTQEQMKKIEEEMWRMVKEGVPFSREEVSIDMARAIMRSQGFNVKEQLIRWVGDDPVILYRCEGVYDMYGGALADTAALISVFDLHLYEGGIFLSRISFHDQTKPIEFSVSAKTFKLFKNYTNWLSHLDIATMDRMHALVAAGRTRDLILLCEALHTKTLSHISEYIESRPEVKLLCLAGPSSSGKTTSSRRLRVQLLSSGIDSETIELDNYFVDRKHTPLDASGKPDFEALEALDLDLVNEHLLALIEGRAVDIPKFDFITGKRSKGYRLQLKPHQLLVIEGIHGLNDRLSASVGASSKYRIFICPLTGTTLDLHNRVGTTDTRLLRRMVRDYRTRGHSPEATLLQWPSVVRGSFRHIFPYQENADVLFNTSLAYELCVLKGYVVPLLNSVPEDSPASGEAYRLLSMLNYVPVIPSDDVPNVSIMREFIGGSCFD